MGELYMRTGIMASSAFLCLVALSASAQDLPPSLQEAGLTWRRPPSLEVMRNRFPMRALIASVWKGEATVSCVVSASGAPRCKAIDEKPGGYDFGKSAVIVVEHTRVRAVDGSSPAGRAFRYGVKFGAWETPVRYQPKDLQWTLMPTFGDWSMKGMKMGDVYWADFSCIAHADGSLNCRIGASYPSGDSSFRAAASRAMNGAKVADSKGYMPKEGATFDYRLKVMRLNWCGTGAYRASGPVQGVISAVSSGGGSANVTFEDKIGASSSDTGQTCTPALALTQ